MQTRSRIWSILLVGNLLLTLVLLGRGVLAQSGGPAEPAAVVSAAFTYQGQLSNAGTPTNGTCDMQFDLYEATGSKVAGTATITKNGVSLANGRFTVSLDFGANAFNGQQRYLEIKVRCPAGSGTYSTLPRQELSAVPYASYAVNAGVATSASSAPWTGLTGIPAGFADGVDNTGAGGSYAQVVTVSASGGTYTSIIAALNSITDASASKRYLVWVGPGTYNYTEAIVMKPYVDIAGAGEGVTIIEHVSDFGTIELAAAVRGASNAELRFLTINTGNADTSNSVGIYNDRVSPTLTYVTITASKSGINHAIYNTNEATSTATIAKPLIRNVTAVATAIGGISLTSYAVLNDEGAAPVIVDSTLSAVGGTQGAGIFNVNGSQLTLTNTTVSSPRYGIQNEGSTAIVHRSTISGTTNSVRNEGSSTMRIGASQLSGTASNSTSTLACVASYKADFTALSATCS